MMDPDLLDDHLDWIIGLLAALDVMALIGLIMLGTILGLLRKWWSDYDVRARGGDDLLGGSHREL